MKVCLISGEFRPMQGGVGDFTYEVGQALHDLEATVTVLTSTAAGPPRHENGLRVEPRLERWGWNSWRTILRTAEELEADVLNIQYQAAAYGMHPAINFLPLRLRTHWKGSLLKQRPRVVVTFHDLKVPYLFPKAGRVRWWVVLALARWSDAVIVTNAEDLETFLRSPIPNPQSPLPAPYLIPIGSNIKPMPPADYDRNVWRARWGVGSEDILLSYFGFLNESKGGETLIRALGKVVKPALSKVEGIAEGKGYPARLLMVGGKWGSSDPANVAYAQRVEALIDELGLSERVMWTGYTPQEEVSANLLASDICVLPYRDGASFRRGSFMAALVHGLPIVTTHCARLPKSDRLRKSGISPHLPRLRDGENVLLVPPDDAAALAQAIARLADDPELRQRLGRGAKEMSKAFGWDSIAEKTLEVYHAVCAK